MHIVCSWQSYVTLVRVDARSEKGKRDIERAWRSAGAPHSVCMQLAQWLLRVAALQTAATTAHTPGSAHSSASGSVVMECPASELR
jgi:hypothetical protein